MEKQIYKKFSLPYLITKLSRAILKEYEQKAKSLEVSPLQGGIIFVMSELSPVSQTDIARILFIDKVTLSKMLMVLEKKKLIEIVKTENRRTKLWKVTEKGNNLLYKIQAIDEQIESKLKKDIKSNGHDSAILIEGLRALLIKTSLNSGSRD